MRDLRWGHSRLTWLAPASPITPERFAERCERWLDIGPMPGVLPTYGARVLDGWGIHAVLDYAPGPSLVEVMCERTVPLEQALAWAAGVTAAVARIQRDGAVPVGPLDGSACRLDAVGALRWIPSLVDADRPLACWGPEGPTPSSAADVYALATTLYGLIVGHGPYDLGPRGLARWRDLLLGPSSGWRGLAGRLWGPRAGVPGALVDLMRDPRSVPEIEALAMLRGHASPMAPTTLGIALPQPVEQVLLAALDPDPERRPPAERLAMIFGRLSPDQADNPRATRVALLTALSWSEVGAPERARRALDTLTPTSVHARINAALLGAADDPRAVVQLARALEQDASLRAAPDWDDVIQAFADRVQRRVAHVDGPIRAVAVRADSGSVVLGGPFSTKARWWDIGGRGGTQPLRGIRQQVRALSFLGEDRLLVVAGRSVVVARVGAAPTWALPLHAAALGAAVVGGEIAVAVPGALLWIDAADGTLSRREARDVTALAAGRAGCVATGSEGVIWWRPEGRVDVIAEEAHRVAVARDGVILASRTRLIYLGLDGTRHEVPFDGAIGCMAAGGSRLAIAIDDRLTVWALPGLTPVSSTRGTGTVGAVDVSEDGLMVVFGCLDGAARCWFPDGEDWPLVVPSGDAAAGVTQVQRDVGERTMRHQERASGAILGLLGTKRDWDTSFDAPIASVACDPAGAVIVAGVDRTVHVSRVVGRTVHLDVMALPCAAEVRAVAVARDGLGLAAALGGGTPDGALRVPGPGVAGARIRVQEPDGVRFSVALGAAGLTIGRGHDRDLVMSDPEVSRRHCTVRWIKGQCVIQDDGSANGFVVGGVPTREAVLRPGDPVQIGHTTITYILTDQEDTPTATDPAPPDRHPGSAPDRTSRGNAVSESVSERTDGPWGRPGSGLVWPMQNPGLCTRIEANTGAVGVIVFRGDGSLLTGADDGSVGCWTPDRVRRVTLRAEGAGPVRALAVSGGDRWLVVGHEDRIARIWDLETATAVRTLEGHRRPVDVVAATRDARHVLTAGREGVARLWLARTGRVLHALPHHGDAVTAAVFTPDGRAILTATAAGQLYVWSRASGHLLHQGDIASDGVSALALVHHGRSLVVAGRDGVLRVWTLRWLTAMPEEVLAAAESLFDPAQSSSATWPLPAGRERDLDFWLDVWTDLSPRVLAAPPPLASRAASIRLRVRVEIARRLPTPGALGSAIGFGRRAHPTPDPLADPFTSVDLVDPGLALSFRSAT